MLTERLRIRPWSSADAATALRIYSDPDVVRWLSDDEPLDLLRDLDHARERIDWWNSPLPAPQGQWAIEVVAPGEWSGKVVGSVLLARLPEDEEIQIGWSLDPKAAGHGFASEAAREVLAFGFANGLERIHALTHLDNHRSVAVARRIQMAYQGVVEAWYPTPSHHFLAVAPGVLA